MDDVNRHVNVNRYTGITCTSYWYCG